MHKKQVFSHAVISLLIVYLLMPLLATFIYSVFETWDGVLPRGFSFQYYVQLFTDREFLVSLGRTMLLCIVPIVVTVLCVLLAMFAVSLYFPKLGKYIQLFCMIPYTLQGVILSVSILSFYAGVPGVLSNRLVMLMGGYCVIILPYVYQGIRNSLQAVNMPTLIEAAETLGASKLFAFFRVIVPNILPGIVVSCLLAQGILFGDYVLARNITGSSFKNVQVYFYLMLKSSSHKASAIFVIIMLVTFLITALVLRLQKQVSGKQARRPE